MKKIGLRSIPHTIFSMWKHMPLVLITRIFFLLSFTLAASCTIGLAVWMILLFIHGILCLIAWRLYRGKYDKAAESGRQGMAASLLTLFFIALNWFIMIRSGFPAAYINWW